MQHRWVSETLTSLLWSNCCPEYLQWQMAVSLIEISEVGPVWWTRKWNDYYWAYYWLHCWWHSCFIPKVNWTWTRKIKRLSRVSVTAGPSGNSPLKWLLIRFVKGLLHDNVSLCISVVTSAHYSIDSHIITLSLPTVGGQLYSLMCSQENTASLLFSWYFYWCLVTIYWCLCVWLRILDWISAWRK